MRDLQNSQDRPYIHLVDGGVADNIGMRAVLETFEAMGASAGFRDAIGFGGYRRIAIIVVNARSAPKTDWDRQDTPPGMLSQLTQASGVPIDAYSFDTVEMMKDRTEIYRWRREILLLRARLAGASEAQAETIVPIPNMVVHTVDVTFEDFPEAKERDYLMNLPTSFVLPPEAVDRLREAAGTLLRGSPDFQALVRDFGGTPAK
jgi:NTE family protein